jgi:hypothetical protein
MDISIQSLLTVGGATALVLILTQILKGPLPIPERYASVLAIALGIVVVGLANVSAVADVRLGWGEAILTGILAGASATGLYEVGKSAVTPT